VDAITEVPNYIGIIEIGKSRDVGFIHGKLDIGRAFSPPIIREIRKNISEADVIILDSPPGTSCPVITTISYADYVILVTEPTPFGVNDLKLAVDMVREVGKNIGIIINRAGIGDNEVYSYCSDENLDIIMEIPHDRNIAQIYSRGGIIVDEMPEYKNRFIELFNSIKSRIVS
jgi:MinD superfamily P-loop ATPase